jgi:plasmid stabilization system protein ParE
MTRGYGFTDRAAHDFETVRDWYAQRSETQARRFVNAVVTAIRAACDRPESYPVAEGAVRAVRCRRFPYRIYDRLDNDRLAVLAINHAARDPGKWNDSQRE